MVNTLNTLENFKELAREAHLLVEEIYIKCDSMNDWEIPLVNYYGSVDNARFEWRRTAKPSGDEIDTDSTTSPSCNSLHKSLSTPFTLQTTISFASAKR